MHCIDEGGREVSKLGGAHLHEGNLKTFTWKEASTEIKTTISL